MPGFSMLWPIVAFGPMIALALLGRRVHLSATPESRADYRDAARIARWMWPCIAALVVGVQGHAETRYVWGALLALLGFYAAQFIIDGYTWRDDPVTRRMERRPATLSHWARVLSTASMMIPAFQTGLITTLYDSILALCAIAAAPSSWDRQDPLVGVPGVREDDDIRRRACAIGERMGRFMVIASLAPKEAARAYGRIAVPNGTSSLMAFSESVVSVLTDRESDAVIAHEIAREQGSDRVPMRGHWVAYSVLALLFLVEAAIRTVAPALSFLEPIKWIALFILPQLAMRWWLRTNSGRWAESAREEPDDPVATISGLCKLCLTDGIPFTRPWWARITYDSPTYYEQMLAIAQAHGIGGRRLAQILARAEAELHGTSPAYEGELAWRPVSRAEDTAQAAAWSVLIPGAAYGLSTGVIMWAIGFGWRPSAIVAAVIAFFGSLGIAVFRELSSPSAYRRPTRTHSTDA